MKKTLKMVSLVLTMVLVLALTVPAEVSAASKTSKALAGYQKLLKKDYAHLNGFTFCLVYIDKDSVPELVVGSTYTGHVSVPEVFTYSGGKVRKMKYAGSDFGRFIYSYKKGVTLNSAYINGFGQVDVFYKWSKSNTKKTVYKKYTADFSKSKAKYLIGKKKVSKKAFNSSIKKTKKKYPLREISGPQMHAINDSNMKKLNMDNYKKLVIKGKK